MDNNGMTYDNVGYAVFFSVKIQNLTNKKRCSEYFQNNFKSFIKNRLGY